MGGLGRLIALPFLLIALVLQGLAPAQATAMPKDAFGLPICSARDLGGTQRRDPAQDRSHDCCAAACALVGVTGGPPPLPQIAAASYGVPLRQVIQHPGDAPTSASDRRPNARGPPVASLTI
jgi:hypothetical protein